MNNVSVSHLFPSSRYQTKCTFNTYRVDDIKNFKIYFQSTSKAMPGMVKKRGRQKIKKFNILRIKKAF